MKDFQDSKKNSQNFKKGIITFNENENLNLYKTAINLQNKGDFVQAAKIYNILLKKNYRTENFFLNYALVCQNLKDIKSSILLFKETIKINSNNFIPYFKMGFILNNNDRFYEAYPFAKRAIELNPNLWQGYHNFIKILINLNRPKEAINIAMKAKNLFSKNHLFSDLLGEEFKNIGCFEEAEKFFKLSISIAPNNEEALYNYANFLKIPYFYLL